MQNIDVLRQALWPGPNADDGSYDEWFSRTYHVLYQTNSALSGKKMADIITPKRQIALYQAQAQGFWGHRWVLFLNGEPRLIDGKDWPRVRREAQLP